MSFPVSLLPLAVYLINPLDEPIGVPLPPSAPPRHTHTPKVYSFFSLIPLEVSIIIWASPAPTVARGLVLRLPRRKKGQLAPAFEKYEASTSIHSQTVITVVINKTATFAPDVSDVSPPFRLFLSRWVGFVRGVSCLLFS